MSAISPLQARRRPLLAALALSLVLLPAPARAQVGGLLGRAAKKAATKVVDNPANSPSSNNAGPRLAGPELTEAQLGGVLRGLAAMATRLDSADAVAQQVTALNGRIGTASDAHQAEQDRWNDLDSRTRQCWDEAQGRLNQSHQQQMQQYMMTKPEAMQQLQEATIEMGRQQQALLARNDTAGLRRLGEEFQAKQMKLMGVDLHADSAAVRKECGSSPAKPAWMVELEGLRARRDALQESERALEQRAGDAGWQASGMTRPDFDIARERVLTWWESKGRGFGDAENRLLSAHQAEIQRVKRAL